MSNKEEIINTQSGIVLEKEQIAEHTFHIKIQSADFAQMKYIAGFTTNIFLGNPYYEKDCEYRKYSFWNYEPVHQVADFAICTFSKGKGAEWVQTLQQGDTIYFQPPSGKLLIDNNEVHYLLIGDITSLSHLYEIHRNLYVSKNVFSFIYSEQEADIFPDIDKSYPFNHHIINPIFSDEILNSIIKKLPEKLENTIAYIFGHPETCIKVHNYLKAERNISTQNLRTKPFWKLDK